MRSILITLASILAAPALSEEMKFFPEETGCIEYSSTGILSGTTLHCHAAFGNETYAKEDNVMEMLGVKQTMSSITITKGADIYAVDLATMTATKTPNPMYDQVMESAGGDPQAFGEQMLISMGFAKTDETMEFDGYTCNVYAGPMGKMCNTAEGYNLYSNVMGLEKTATRVGIGESPPDELLGLLEQVEIVEGPAMPEGFGMGAEGGAMPEGIAEMLKELGLGAQPQ